MDDAPLLTRGPKLGVLVVGTMWVGGCRWLDDDPLTGVRGSWVCGGGVATVGWRLVYPSAE